MELGVSVEMGISMRLAINVEVVISGCGFPTEKPKIVLALSV